MKGDPMNVPYEQSARKIHKSARNFTPVTSGLFSKRVLGWVFEVKLDSGSYYKFSWMSRDFAISSDLTGRDKAVKNLKSFVKNASGQKVFHAANTGNATAAGDGTANTGISFTGSD